MAMMSTKTDDYSYQISCLPSNSSDTICTYAAAVLKDNVIAGHLLTQLS